MDTESRRTRDYPEDIVVQGDSLRRVSWGAIFAGAILALSVALTLGMLGFGIGLGVVNPTEQDPLGGVGVGAGIWFGLSTLISLFLGGMTAGRLAGIPRSRNDGMIHGIIVWAVASLATFYIMTTAVGMLVSGVTGVIGKGLSLLAGGVQAVAPQAMEAAQEELQQRGFTIDQMIEEAQKQLTQPESQSGKQTSNEQLGEALKRYLANPNQEGSRQDRQAVIDALVARGMSRQDAENAVNTWTQRYYQVRQRAEQVTGQALATSEQVMDAISKAAIWNFFAMLIGVIVAAVGGKLGSPKYPLTALR